MHFSTCISQVSIDMGKGKGKGFSRIAKLVTASARDQQASPQVTMMIMTYIEKRTCVAVMAFLAKKIGRKFALKMA